jgi:hypothetical protein
MIPNLCCSVQTTSSHNNKTDHQLVKSDRDQGASSNWILYSNLEKYNFWNLLSVALNYFLLWVQQGGGLQGWHSAPCASLGLSGAGFQGPPPAATNFRHSNEIFNWWPFGEWFHTTARERTLYDCVFVWMCLCVCVCRALHQAVPHARILITRVCPRFHIYEFFQPLRVHRYMRLIQPTFKVNEAGSIFESATTLPNPYLRLNVPLLWIKSCPKGELCNWMPKHPPVSIPALLNVLICVHCKSLWTKAASKRLVWLLES